MLFQQFAPFTNRTLPTTADPSQNKSGWLGWNGLLCSPPQRPVLRSETRQSLGDGATSGEEQGKGGKRELGGKMMQVGVKGAQLVRVRMSVDALNSPCE